MASTNAAARSLLQQLLSTLPDTATTGAVPVGVGHDRDEQLAVTYERSRDYPSGKGCWRGGSQGGDKSQAGERLQNNERSQADEIRSLNRRLKERDHSMAQMRADGREKTQKIKVSNPSSPPVLQSLADKTPIFPKVMNKAKGFLGQISNFAQVLGWGSTLGTNFDPAGASEKITGEEKVTPATKKNSRRTPTSGVCDPRGGMPRALLPPFKGHVGGAGVRH